MQQNGEREFYGKSNRVRCDAFTGEIATFLKTTKYLAHRSIHTYEARLYHELNSSRSSRLVEILCTLTASIRQAAAKQGTFKFFFS